MFNLYNIEVKWMMKYYYASQVSMFNSSSNEGIAKAREIIEGLAEQGEIQMIDTTVWSKEKRFEVYGDVMTVAVLKRSAVRRIYGTNRHPAVNFGKQVPSLVVYDSNGNPIDAYPREVEGEAVTILDYLLILN
jgi:hypothetical protein